MRAKTKIVVVIAALAAVGCVTCWLHAGTEVIVTAYDVLATPGETVRLRAKVETKGLVGVHPDAHDVEVRFDVGGAEVGRAKTGDDGYAEVDWKAPDAAGDHRITAAPTSDAYEGAAGTATAFVRALDTRFFVTDIDHTISDYSQLDVALAPVESIPVVAGADRALRELAKERTVIYLTARDDRLLNHTRAWLAYRSFPPGPVFTRDIKLTNLSDSGHKKEVLLPLKQKWAWIEAGAGERREDGETYLLAKMRGYVLGNEAPEGAVIVNSWDEIVDRERLLKPDAGDGR